MTEPNRNYMLRMWLLLCSLLCILALMYYLPERIDTWELKPIDILGELRKTTDKDSISIEPSPLAQVPTIPKSGARVDSVNTSSIIAQANLDSTNVAIEDGSPNRSALSKFFRALSSRHGLGRPVRIAVLGDSFIEGDIFTAPLRNELQKRYGGSGVGLLPITSQTAKFRTSVQHTFSGWKDRSLLSSKEYQSIMGYYYTGTSGASVEYRLPKNSSPFDCVHLYYQATEETPVTFETDDATREYLLSSSPEGLSNIEFRASSMTHCSLKLSASNSTRFYGMALESEEGVIVDNLSLRGSPGTRLAHIDRTLSQQLLKLRKYDLIILQYGLNVANPKQKDYSYYTQAMIGVVELLRSMSPDTDFLIMGVSDRASKTSRGIETMPGILQLHQAQQQIALSTGSAFWSLYRAMRNRGGIAEMAKENKAAKDYTHLTHKGGEDLAQDFINALNLEYQYYEAIK